MYGKALGNGYAITAIVGRKSIMDYAQSTFISSTFWTERSGPVAALQTLKVMENIKSWKIISKTGKSIKKNWTKIAKKNKIGLIEDAAESIGSKVNKQNVGTFGELGIFSFAGNKILTSGEGGAIVTNSRAKFEKLKLIRSHGRKTVDNYLISH